MVQPNFTPQPAPPKKGLPVIAWIGIGCLALVVIGGIAVVGLGMFAAKKAKDFAHEMEANPAKTTAEMIVRMNPELELVASDESAGTITIRQKKTGKVATFKYADLEKGRFTFEGEDGRVEINTGADGEGVTVKTDEGVARFGGSASAGNVPAWVPVHPEATQVDGSFATKTAGQETGAVSFTVPGGVDGVIAHYRTWMENNGFKVATSAMTEGTGLLVGQNQAQGRNLNVTCAPGDDGGTRVAIQYTSTSR
jgi:hypothetical protein